MGPPTSNSTCTRWMLAELREWVGRDGAASSSRTAVPVLDDDDDGAAHPRLKSDETYSSASVNRAYTRLGPGPRVAGVPKESCGNPSTWLPQLQSCETWVRTNPLAGLPPLPKPHWGWGFDPGYIDTAGKPAAYRDPARNQTAATMRALLTDLARITGSLSADIGCSGPDCAATEATRMKTLVEICTAAMQAHGTRQPQLSIRLSPWYVKFKGGHDPCSTDGEAAELQRLRTSLTHLATLLHDANQAAGTNISFGAILVDSELFSWGPNGGDGQVNGDGVDCITRKNELVYNLSKECWPTAEPIFYDYGSTYFTPQGCGRNTSRADRCFNLSPTVPMGFDMELTGTFEESFAKKHPFTVSLYNIDEPLVTREKFKYTVENAGTLPGGVGTVIPWVALGASVHRNASAPDIDYQGNHSQSTADVPFFESTFDFSAMLDGGYDRSLSMQMGAELNLPGFNSSLGPLPTGEPRTMFPFFGPFEKAVGVVFFPGVLGEPDRFDLSRWVAFLTRTALLAPEYRSAPSPWNEVGCRPLRNAEHRSLTDGCGCTGLLRDPGPLRCVRERGDRRVVAHRR